MKKIHTYFVPWVVIISGLFFVAAEAPAPLKSPGDIDLYRQLGLRLEKKVGDQNARQLHCVVEDPRFLKQLGMADTSKGDEVLLIQEDKDKWLVKNKTSGRVVSVEATIREFYDNYKPKL